MYVQAKDLGPNAVPAHCKVIVRVLDANDNAPRRISFSTVKEAVSEGAARHGSGACSSVTDRDSGKWAGAVRAAGGCAVPPQSSAKNYCIPS